MGLWTTFVQALGLERTPTPGARQAPRLGPGALRRLALLPAGSGATLQLEPVPAGSWVRVQEGPVAKGHPGFEGLPVVCDDGVFERLHGATIEHDGDRWRLLVDVKVTARETPNPNGRAYATDRTLAYGRVYAATLGSRPPWLAAHLLARPDVNGVLLRDNTLTIERVPGTPWSTLDAAVGTAVRAWALALGEPATEREAGPADDVLTAARAVLAQQILPALHADGGDAELIALEDGVATVRLVGACRSCPAASLTLKGGIERVLVQAFPGEIDRVVAED